MVKFSPGERLTCDEALEHALFKRVWFIWYHTDDSSACCTMLINIKLLWAKLWNASLWCSWSRWRWEIAFLIARISWLSAYQIVWTQWNSQSVCRHRENTRIFQERSAMRLACRLSIELAKGIALSYMVKLLSGDELSFIHLFPNEKDHCLLMFLVHDKYQHCIWSKFLPEFRLQFLLIVLWQGYYQTS